MTPSLMPAGPDAQHMLDPSSISVVIVIVIVIVIHDLEEHAQSCEHTVHFATLSKLFLSDKMQVVAVWTRVSEAHAVEGSQLAPHMKTTTE